MITNRAQKSTEYLKQLVKIIKQNQHNLNTLALSGNSMLHCSSNTLYANLVQYLKHNIQ